MNIIRFAKAYHPTEVKKRNKTKRSSQWESLRLKWLQHHPCCAVCGSTSKLEVHHIKPFHTHPELELDPGNLVTLCENKKKGINCHLFAGHLGNYKTINVNLRMDVNYLNSMINDNYQRVTGEFLRDQKMIQECY